MKEIELKSNIVVFIDDEDYDKVKDYCWSVSKSGNFQYARAFYKIGNKQKSVLLQHLIVGKPPKGQRILFKDKNALNCQKENIEFVSCGQAAHHYYKKHKNSKNAQERFRGVIVQYVARIKFNNKILVLGSFENERDAAQAYNKKALELYGDKAVINYV
ncbi:MAG: hypothetical protein ACK4NY_21110 [Spirosomataceae bacterium]